MTKERACQLAKDWYIAYLDKYPPTPYDDTLMVHTEAEQTDEAWYVVTWSDALEARSGLMVYDDETVEWVDEP